MKFKSDKQRKAVMSKMQERNGSSSASASTISQIRNNQKRTNVSKIPINRVPILTNTGSIFVAQKEFYKIVDSNKERVTRHNTHINLVKSNATQKYSVVYSDVPLKDNKRESVSKSIPLGFGKYTPEKKLVIQNGLGATKYAVSWTDGRETHKDGSPFYNIRFFKNKEKQRLFIGDLEQKGYKG